MNLERVRQLNSFEYVSGPIVYWMNRDERVQDNWALLFAQQLAKEKQVPLLVVFNLVTDFLGGGLRQLAFKIGGLKEIQQDLAKKNISFFVIQTENDAQEILEFVQKSQAGTLVTDFFPLRISKKWVTELRGKILIPFYEVDAHNIVPCWVASPKQEYGAYTLRPKLNRLLPRFLEQFPKLEKQTIPWAGKVENIDWDLILENAKTDRSIQPVSWIKPGEKASREALTYFLQNQLEGYDQNRNDPNKKALSNLSPYLHYGQISAQRIALEVKKHGQDEAAQGSFLEELIIRKELSDNYCYYNQDYDNFQGFPAWAQKTLEEHRTDKREHLYTLSKLENAETADELWNASQLEMVKSGKIHGYMRMYWAKKILEWTNSPEEAQKFAIYLNDKYELDGRDPNGYVGIAWAIGGLHDRAWFSHPVFGKVRYMNYNGCKSKFDVKAYAKAVEEM